MLAFLTILAQVDPGASNLPSPESGARHISWLGDMAVVVGFGIAVLVLSALVLKLRKGTAGSRNSSRGSTEGGDQPQRRRRRKKRRTHRPRNPTLAEKGIHDRFSNKQNTTS